MLPTSLRLTRVEEDVWNYIALFQLEHGYPPTYGEIQEDCALYSRELAWKTVHTLAAKGYVALPAIKDGQRCRPARAISLLVWPREVVDLFVRTEM
jgi:SOS-response transcriptional repressor LexA